MHILYVSDMDTMYGASQGLRQMVEGFRKYYPEVEITVVLPMGIRRRKAYTQRAAEFKALGCETVQIRYDAYQISKQRGVLSKIKTYLQRLFGLTWGMKRLASRIDMTQIDIIHSNSTREDFGAAVAQRYHKPLVWHIREFGDLDYQIISLRKKYIDYMNQCAALCIAVSDVIRKHWIYKGIKAEKIKTIYDGVDERITPKQRYSSDFNRKLRFVMLGSVQETKGQDHLIEALGLLEKDNLNRLRVDIIGGHSDSDYLIRLQKRIEDLELAQTVQLLGYRENFREKLSEYDCGLMCSRSEAFGFVTMEYMAAGLPVIAAATGANPEIVLDGQVGFLYNPQDSKNLMEKIRNIIVHPELCEQMGHKAEQYVKEQFSIRKSIGQIYYEYKKLVTKEKVYAGEPIRKVNMKVENLK